MNIKIYIFMNGKVWNLLSCCAESKSVNHEKWDQQNKPTQCDKKDHANKNQDTKRKEAQTTQKETIQNSKASFQDCIPCRGHFSDGIYMGLHPNVTKVTIWRQTFLWDLDFSRFATKLKESSFPTLC